jgi:hypothetical protein
MDRPTQVLSLDDYRRRVNAGARGMVIRTTDEQRPKSQAVRNARRGLLRPWSGLTRLVACVIRGAVDAQVGWEVLSWVARLEAYVLAECRARWPEALWPQDPHPPAATSPLRRAA